jgi:TRAP-type C4-dicarboxylate transport system substrate-binding protein
MFRRFASAALAASFVVMGATGAAHAQDKGKDKGAAAPGGKVTLKMATLAPPRSPWGKVFKTWAKAVEQKTDGKVEIQWLWNGTAGPETAVVGKIKSGQIAGAPLTAVGLADVHKPILALQFPGAFKSWEELDKAREMLRPDFEKAVADNGFTISGWGDVGVGRVMSKGFAVKVPADMRGKSPAMIREDVIAPKVYEVIGGVRGVPDTVMGFLPKLNSGAINVMNTPPLAAEQLQWAPRLDHMNTNGTYYGMGATLLSQKELDKLTADQREIMLGTGKQASAALKGTIRKEDDAAFERLKKKMTIHNPSDAEKAEWKKVFTEACKRLKSSLPGNVLSRIGAC